MTALPFFVNCGTPREIRYSLKASGIGYVALRYEMSTRKAAVDSLSTSVQTPNVYAARFSYVLFAVGKRK